MCDPQESRDPLELPPRTHKTWVLRRVHVWAASFREVRMRVDQGAAIWGSEFGSVLLNQRQISAEPGCKLPRSLEFGPIPLEVGPLSGNRANLLTNLDIRWPELAEFG